MTGHEKAAWREIQLGVGYAATRLEGEASVDACLYAVAKHAIAQQGWGPEDLVRFAQLAWRAFSGELRGDRPVDSRSSASGSAKRRREG